MNPLSPFQRKVYEGLKKQYPTQVIAPGRLRLESTITNSGNIIPFTVLQDTTTPLRTEKRLNKNDIFFVTELGFFIYKRVIGEEGAGVLQSYVNQTVFPAVAGVGDLGFNPADLEVVYNSAIKLKVGTKTFIESLDTNRFLDVPQTQQSGSTNRSQKDGNAGFYELPTHLIFRGVDEIELTVEVPVFGGIQMAADAVQTTATHQLVIIPRGFIIKGGANIKPVQLAPKAV